MWKQPTRTLLDELLNSETPDETPVVDQMVADTAPSVVDQMVGDAEAVGPMTAERLALREAVVDFERKKVEIGHPFLVFIFMLSAKDAYDEVVSLLPKYDRDNAWVDGACPYCGGDHWPFKG